MITDDDIRAVRMEAAQMDLEAAKMRLNAAGMDERAALERLKAAQPMLTTYSPAVHEALASQHAHFRSWSEDELAMGKGQD